MRITLTASSDELGISHSSPLGRHYFRLFVWRYMPSPQYPEMDSGASFTVKRYDEGESGGEGELVMDRKLESNDELQALSEALSTMDGHALQGIVLPMLEKQAKNAKPRKKASRKQ